MNAQSVGLVCLLLTAGLSHAGGGAQVIDEVDAAYPTADAQYLDLHRHPELSFHEQRTAAKLAAALRELGFAVTTGVGRTGLVGVLNNGAGPTVLLRTELDALPVEEKTGLPYASTVRTKDDGGSDVGVAHACGHDVHMTAWTTTARIMAASRDRWRGTLVMMGQPAEELGTGAAAMLKDGLLTRFPRPDYAIAVHDDARYPAGLIGVHPGAGFAAVDTVNITIYGRGGHGARPETTVDPVVIAARTVLTLQTIVSRENSPFDPAVITVGSIHGGTRPNIIPSEVKLELTVRSFSEPVRQHLLSAIERIAKAEAAAAAAPSPPLVERIDPNYSLINDPTLAARATAALVRELGPARIKDVPPEGGAEDFSEVMHAGIPTLDMRIGAVPQATYDAAMKSGEAPPSLHSALFAPDREPTIKAAVEAEVVVLRELMPAKESR